MGRMSTEAVELKNVDELTLYLVKEHNAYMQCRELTYYLTDANDIYWRAQDTNALNDKGHFTDCSELVASVREFIDLPFIDGKESIRDVFDECTFYASRKIEGQGSPVPVV